MRLVSYAAPDGPAVGVVRDEAVVPVAGTDMLALIAAGPAGLARARQADGPPVPLAGLTLLLGLYSIPLRNAITAILQTLL